MSTINVLDCTLRDGGYVNDWNFGEKNISKIIADLIDAKIEYIECGFLKNVDYNPDKTIFNDINLINNFVKEKKLSNIVAMIVFGQFPQEKITPKTNQTAVDGIRVTFKKHEIDDVYPYFQHIKSCGYKTFVNPTNIDTYTDFELLCLVNKINQLKPFGFSIVDTKGLLKEKDLTRLFYILDNNLDKDIKICFHSHNNLQLSFSNAQVLARINSSRELIIDSCVFGMGRGAGNLCSELISQYLNDNYNKNYNILPMLNIIDEQLNKIFAQTPWGYTVPYYLAATNSCHPNYANFLVDKQTVPIKVVNELLNRIPQEKRNYYDANLIKELYLNYQKHFVDDKEILKKLKAHLCDKSILILAPGKSLANELDKVKNFIDTHKPFVISINFLPDNIKTDLAFISNMKRFNSLTEINIPFIVTSNIDIEPPENAAIINYSSYLNSSSLADNATLMLLNLMKTIDIKKVDIAGFDGFSKDANDNYFSTSLITPPFKEIDKMNAIISEEINKLTEFINMNFITKTHYNIKTRV